MKLSSIPIGAPFRFDGRVFYKLRPHLPHGRISYTRYECYEVVRGFLQLPAFYASEELDVEPYVFTKNKNQ